MNATAYFPLPNLRQGFGVTSSETLMTFGETQSPGQQIGVPVPRAAFN